MGTIRKLFAITVLSILVIFFAPGLPPDIEFQAFTLEPPLSLEGKLAPNNILDKAEEIILDKGFQGPESTAGRNDDEIFTGFVLGELVRINKDGKSKTIAKMGKGKCEGYYDVKNCGRIAGVRFGIDGKLYVADVSYGIFKVDVDAETVETLVSTEIPIDGKRPGLPDDLDVSKDGTIYWSDATTIGDVENIILELLGVGTGRLIKYDPKTKKNTVLVQNLHFANGVQLSKNEDFVLVTETARARVIRYYLKGEKKGQTDVFVDRLPGLPDNLRPSDKGGFYIVLSTPRIPSELSFVDLLGPLPLVRRFICRLLHITISTMKMVESLFPGPLMREWIAYIAHLGPLGDLENLPYKTIVVETDGEGNIVGSLQNEKGPVKCLSEVRLGKDYAYFGSPAQRKMFRIKKEFLP